MVFVFVDVQCVCKSSALILLSVTVFRPWKIPREQFGLQGTIKGSADCVDFVDMRWSLNSTDCTVE